MLGDLVASADPDPVVAQDVIDEAGKRGGPHRLAGEPAMQSDGHHLRRLLAFAGERVEIVAQRDKEILGLTPAQATREARVVVVERVRDDEMWPAVIVGPIGQLVVVGVAVIKEPAFLNDKAPRIGARRADVPADRPRSGQSPNGLDGEADMLSLGCFIDAVIVEPAPSVIDDITALTRHGLGALRVALERHADGIDRRDHLPLGEDAHQTPEADTTAVFVSRLHVKIARTLEWGRHEKIGEARLGDLVAVQHAALATLLIVDDEIEGEAGPTGPTRIWRLVGIADEIARIAGHRRRAAVMAMSLSGARSSCYQDTPPPIKVVRGLVPGKLRNPVCREIDPAACSGCFRLERIAGWGLHPLESAALSRRTWKPVLRRGHRVMAAPIVAFLPVSRVAPR